MGTHTHTHRGWEHTHTHTHTHTHRGWENTHTHTHTQRRRRRERTIQRRRRRRERSGASFQREASQAPVAVSQVFRGKPPRPHHVHCRMGGGGVGRDGGWSRAGSLYSGLWRTAARLAGVDGGNGFTKQCQACATHCYTCVCHVARIPRCQTHLNAGRSHE